MKTDHMTLIAELAGDLAPVRHLRRSEGATVVACAFMGTLVLVWQVFGFWTAGLAGRAEPIFYITNLLLLLLGASAVAAALRAAMPGVGNRYDGPRWALAMIAVLPVVALVELAGGDGLKTVAGDPEGFLCLGKGVAFATLIAAGATWWVRRGAPVVPQSAGFLVGIASGSLGSAAYGLACPIDTLGHLSVFHLLPVAVGGVVGRYGLARLLAW